MGNTVLVCHHLGFVLARANDKRHFGIVYVFQAVQVFDAKSTGAH